MFENNPIYLLTTLYNYSGGHSEMNRKRRNFVEWGAIWTTTLAVVAVEILKVTVGYAWEKFLRWKWPMKRKRNGEKNGEEEKGQK